jgi:acyl-CoA dehydrogenase
MGHTVRLVGKMESAFATAELAFDHMIRIAETSVPGPATTQRALFARTLAGRSATETVECAMEVAGASFYRGLGIERAFRDVQGARFHPLSEAP